MIISLDIETKCALACTKGCNHGLSPDTSNISLVACYAVDASGNEIKSIHRDAGSLNSFLLSFDEYGLIGQNFKFDLKHLQHHGWYKEGVAHWVGDTQLMGATCLDKVPDHFLASYELQRAELNAKLPKGYSHRKASPLSLKTMAPYFLGVPAFWEDPTNHDSEEYALKDVEYTYKLWKFFTAKLQDQNLLTFYEKLLQWNIMLFKAEEKGITIDLKELERQQQDALIKSEELLKELDVFWRPAYTHYRYSQFLKLDAAYDDKAQEALSKKPEATEEQRSKIISKYAALCAKAKEKVPEKMNVDSPSQIAWILKDHFKLDIKNFDDEETTGKEVLQRLAKEGRMDLDLYLKYRKQKKLATAFFPSYVEMQKDGLIHTQFNITGTRTGRLSSSHPNLQQVPKDLHSLFIAREGMCLITRDLSNIEPILIAYITNDPKLCDIVIRGRNFHDVNAIAMFDLECAENEVKEKFPKERMVAKTVGLALLYGAGPYRIQHAAMQAGFSWTLAHCKDVFDKFKDNYKEAFLCKAEIDKLALTEAIPNIYGRKHYYEDPSEIHMKAFNTVVQSSASDLLLEATHQATKEFQEKGINCYPLLWVHDECVFEAPIEKATECETIIEKHLLARVLKTDEGIIPLKCEGKTGRTWEK